MGNFLSVIAIRSDEAGQVTKGLQDHFSAFGVTVTDVAASAPSDDRHDISIYPARNGWVVVLFPAYFNIYDLPVARTISRVLNTQASLVHTYDSEYWAHFAVDRGEIVDRYCSKPQFFGQADASVTKTWAGNPDVVAELLGGHANEASAYFAHDVESVEQPPNGFFSKILGRKPASPLYPKAFPTDQFDLSSEWVFVDLWTKIGILYPDDISSFEQRFRLGRNFEKKIEANDDDVM